MTTCAKSVYMGPSTFGEIMNKLYWEQRVIAVECAFVKMEYDASHITKEQAEMWVRKLIRKNLGLTMCSVQEADKVRDIAASIVEIIVSTDGSEAGQSRAYYLMGEEVEKLDETMNKAIMTRLGIMYIGKSLEVSTILHHASNDYVCDILEGSSTKGKMQKELENGIKDYFHLEVIPFNKRMPLIRDLQNYINYEVGDLIDIETEDGDSPYNMLNTARRIVDLLMEEEGNND